MPNRALAEVIQKQSDHKLYIIDGGPVKAWLADKGIDQVQLAHRVPFIPSSNKRKGVIITLGMYKSTLSDQFSGNAWAQEHTLAAICAMTGIPWHALATHIRVPEPTGKYIAVPWVREDQVPFRDMGEIYTKYTTKFWEKMRDGKVISSSEGIYGTPLVPVVAEPVAASPDTPTPTVGTDRATLAQVAELREKMVRQFRGVHKRHGTSDATDVKILNRLNDIVANQREGLQNQREIIRLLKAEVPPEQLQLQQGGHSTV